MWVVNRGSTEADFNPESVEDEDEVLTALSDELGRFVEYVGGPEYGHVLLSPLENLAAIEEPLVREKVWAQPQSLKSTLMYAGRRVSQQNLRPAFTVPSRGILHTPNSPSFQSRLVYFEDFRNRPIQCSVR